MTLLDGMLRVLILDDQLVQREGFARIVENTGVMRVVAATGSPSEALEYLGSNPVDLALVDLVLDQQRGTVIGRSMRRIQPNLAVIMYTGEKSMVLAADIFWSNKEKGQPDLQGYLLTGSITGSDTLRQVYDRVVTTGYYMDPRVLEWYYRFTEFEPLTRREEECAMLLAKGTSNQVIGEKMGVSRHWVENMISTLYLKFRILGEPGNPGRRVLLAEAVRLLYGFRIPEKPLSVLIVDDDEKQRARLRQRLSGDGRLLVVAEAECGLTGMQAVYLNKPDVVLVDIHLPDLDGFSLTRQILKELPEVCVILQSTERGQVFEEEARRAGAVALLSKRQVTADSVYTLCRPVSPTASHV
jgi:DNA-binding NarL/FixJ family response regulator